MKRNTSFLSALLILSASLAWAQAASESDATYAERLGWPKGSKVVIFHVDDAGMCHDANLGVIESMDEGLATSTSIMMPCAWVSEYAQHVKEHPDTDAGVHLTLTSEWDHYRWGPVAGKKAVPGLVDEAGCLWDNVPLVLEHASPDEIETEIRAQIDRCVSMGIEPTHLDSHMGTLFASVPYFERYCKVGAELGIPILLPGGHMQYSAEEVGPLADGAKAAAEQIWAAGLPIIDDVHTSGYSWDAFDEKKAKLIEFLHDMKPGITEFILHCTKPTENFKYISGSGPTREADLRVMLDEDVKKAIEEEGIILTTWRELKERRAAVAAGK